MQGSLKSHPMSGRNPCGLFASSCRSSFARKVSCFALNKCPKVVCNPRLLASSSIFENISSTSTAEGASTGFIGNSFSSSTSIAHPPQGWNGCALFSRPSASVVSIPWTNIGDAMRQAPTAGTHSWKWCPRRDRSPDGPNYTKGKTTL